MYTPEQVERMEDNIRNGAAVYFTESAANMLRAYAATLKAAQGGVTEAMVFASLLHEAKRLRDEFASLPRSLGYEYTHMPSINAAITAAEAALSAQQGEGEAWDARGGSLWLDREQWGVVIDALIEHRASAAKRKNGNPDSTSDVRADECGDLIGKITSAAKSITAPPAQPAERVPEGFMAAAQDAHAALSRMIAKSEAADVSEIAALARLSDLLAPSPARGDGGEE